MEICYSIYRKWQNKLKNFFSNNKASFSIALSLMLVGILFLQLTIGFLAGRSLYHNLLYKALDQQLEYSLSYYDRGLKERFCLLGLAKLPEHKVFYHLVKQFPAPYLYTRPFPYYEATFLHNFSESDDLLEEAIRNATFLRGGIKLTNEVKERLNFIRGESKVIHNEVTASITRASEAFNDLKNTLSYDEEEIVENNEEETRERENNFNLLNDFIKEIEQNLEIGVNISFKDEELSTDLSNSIFSNLGKLHSIFLDVSSTLNNSLVDKLTLVLYIINNFSFLTAPLGKVEINDSNQDYSLHKVLLNGNNRSDYPEIEKLEVEQLVTGTSSKQALSEIKNIEWISRLFTHIYVLHQNPEYQAYLSKGKFISTIVSILSLGKIYIPASSIASLIIIVKSFSLANSDLVKLNKGEGVEFIPKHTSFLIFHSDYLILRGLVNTKVSLLKRIAEFIKKNTGEDYYLGIRGEVLLEERGSIAKLEEERIFDFRKTSKYKED